MLLMSPDDSKLARLLPGIASQKAVTQESAKNNAVKERPPALPSAYAAERKERVGWLSVICLAFAFVGGTFAFALSSASKSIAADVSHGGSPLVFWEDFSGNVLLHPQGDTFHAAIFVLDVAFWVLAALSVWGACHWIIVRWYSRRWRFSLADM